MSKVWVQLTEVDDLLNRFLEELRKPSGDGKTKRARGEKPPWYNDDSHEAAIYSHLTKWKRGEVVDLDSGAHPLVHLAWRALAIACRETGNVPMSDTDILKAEMPEQWARCLDTADMGAFASEFLTFQEQVKLGLPPKAPERTPKTTDTDMEGSLPPVVDISLEGLREPCKSTVECCNLWPRCFSCPHAPLRGWDQ